MCLYSVLGRSLLTAWRTQSGLKAAAPVKFEVLYLTVEGGMEKKEMNPEQSTRRKDF